MTNTPILLHRIWEDGSAELLAKCQYPLHADWLCDAIVRDDSQREYGVAVTNTLSGKMTFVHPNSKDN